MVASVGSFPVWMGRHFSLPESAADPGLCNEVLMKPANGAVRKK